MTIGPRRKQSPAAEAACRRSRRAAERGAALVEMAFVAPLIGGLVLGVLEAGWFMQNYLTLEEITREAARTVAVHGTEADADHQALESVDGHLGANDRDVIERIVIYRIANPSDQPSVACRTGPAPGSAAEGCSIYPGSELGKPAASLTCGWCPGDRQPGERFGVWIELGYESPTGLLPDRLLDHTSVQRLEPGS